MPWLTEVRGEKRQEVDLTGKDKEMHSQLEAFNFYTFKR
jgi:hypothetical protein